MRFLSSIFGNNNRSSVENQVRLRAEEFIIQYGEQYKGLDFSVQSLTTLDRMLVELLDSGHNHAESATNMSSYLLWVAKQQYGGKFYWSESHSQPVLVIGLPDYRIAFMPYIKVAECIKSNIGEVTNFYRQLGENIEKAPKGADLLLS